MSIPSIKQILKRVDGGTIIIKIADIGKHVKFVIQDDSVGMDEEKLSHILSGSGENPKEPAWSIRIED